ncbi:MAG: hypothetical protein ACYCVH_14765 [Ignavibacteriaceae bacterium]
MKLDSIIYLVALSPLFSVSEIPVFETFDKENSLLLYNALALNHQENLSLISGTYSSVSCFDERDKDFLPEVFVSSHMVVDSHNPKTFFADTRDKKDFLKRLAEKYSNRHLNNLMIFTNSIGISADDVSKAFNLLSMEDEAIVIGKAQNNRIAFLGFNSFNQDLLQEINWDNLNYDNFLSKVSKHENFIHVLDNYLSIQNLSDFKQLYIELSKKESLNYCSQQMHEKFTHLFIEYKESLK